LEAVQSLGLSPALGRQCSRRREYTDMLKSIGVSSPRDFLKVVREQVAEMAGIKVRP
jgi:hypothetical protein